MHQINTRWISLSEVDQVAPLFDKYRQFYEKPADLGLSRALLTARLQSNQSVVALAEDEAGATCGFVQLYPLFSSLAMSVERSKVWLLNDLFVSADARRRGVGEALLTFVQNWAASEGAGYLMLETAKTNLTAQRLYEAQGWQRDNEFYVYQFSVTQ